MLKRGELGGPPLTSQGPLYQRGGTSSGEPRVKLVERTRTINRLTADTRIGCVRDSMEIKTPLLRILLFFCVKLLLFGVQVSPNTCISSESQDQVRASIKSISSPHAPSLVKWAIVCLAKPDSSGSIVLRNEALISSLRPYAS